MCVCVRAHTCVCACVHVHTHSFVRLFATLWTVVCSLVRGILQARILEWVAISSSRGSSQPRDGTHVSWVSGTVRWVLYHWATWEAHIDIKCRTVKSTCVNKWQIISWSWRAKKAGKLYIFAIICNSRMKSLWKKLWPEKTYTIYFLTIFGFPFPSSLPLHLGTLSDLSLSPCHFLCLSLSFYQLFLSFSPSWLLPTFIIP